MTCPIKGKFCHKYKAYQVTEKINNDIKSYMVCEDCLYSNDRKMDISKDKEKTCDFCGITLTELLKGTKLGCASCYVCFDQVVSKIINNVQQSPDIKDLKHVGAVPDLWIRQEAEKTNLINFSVELNQKLRIAIKNEEYEKANEFKLNIKEYSSILDRYQKEQVPLLKEELVQFIYNYRKKYLN